MTLLQYCSKSRSSAIYADVRCSSCYERLSIGRLSIGRLSIGVLHTDEYTRAFENC